MPSLGAWGWLSLYSTCDSWSQSYEFTPHVGCRDSLKEMPSLPFSTSEMSALIVLRELYDCVSLLPRGDMR